MMCITRVLYVYVYIYKVIHFGQWGKFFIMRFKEHLRDYHWIASMFMLEVCMGQNFRPCLGPARKRNWNLGPSLARPDSKDKFKFRPAPCPAIFFLQFLPESLRMKWFYSRSIQLNASNKHIYLLTITFSVNY